MEKVVMERAQDILDLGVSSSKFLNDMWVTCLQDMSGQGINIFNLIGGIFASQGIIYLHFDK
jgi:hypothetical protein